MWIKRDFDAFTHPSGPVKVLKGPRQVGKTALLAHRATHRPIYFDDLATRRLAQENPRFFLGQQEGPLLLDEATLAPELFIEIKRRVDAARRGEEPPLDVWITGSNQTLLQRTVRESLAGRASYFDLNTLSVHELGARYSLSQMLLRGGWPELYASPELDPVRYLNDLIATFIEKDIVSAAGIERKAAFSRALQLAAGRVGQLFNASDIARNVGADVQSIQSWFSVLEENGILRRVEPYFSNLNQRLIKAPKYFLEDVGLAVRLQGWSDVAPILVSPAFGSLFENLALNEICRFFINRGEQPRINFVRTKEKVELDFLVHLSNQRVLAIEVKTTVTAITGAQKKMLESLDLNIIEQWVVCLEPSPSLPSTRVVAIESLWSELAKL